MAIIAFLVKSNFTPKMMWYGISLNPTGGLSLSSSNLKTTIVFFNSLTIVSCQWLLLCSFTELVGILNWIGYLNTKLNVLIHWFMSHIFNNLVPLFQGKTNYHANTDFLSIPWATAYSETSIGLHPFKILRGIHEDMPSSHSTSIFQPLVLMRHQ